jgi:hypothetical protein
MPVLARQRHALPAVQSRVWLSLSLTKVRPSPRTSAAAGNVCVAG